MSSHARHEMRTTDQDTWCRFTLTYARDQESLKHLPPTINGKLVDCFYPGMPPTINGKDRRRIQKN